jgi:DNA-directed RNA polymerase specialized sigma24 family protein
MPRADADSPDRETPLPPAPAPSSPLPDDSAPQPVSAVPAPSDSSPSFGGEAPSQKTPVLGVSPAVLHAYLSLPETQRGLRNVVAHTLGPMATRELVDELANEAQVAAITAEEQAESASAMPGWLDDTARKAVHAWQKEKREERALFVRGGLRRTDAAPAPPVHEEEDLLLSPWLKKRAHKVAGERELLEMLAYAARTKKTYDEVAAERGTTAAAIYNRIYRLKEKYAGDWAEHRNAQMRSRAVFLWLKRAGVAVALGVVVALAYWLLQRPHAEEARPTDDLPRIEAPAPTATGFDNAAPTQPDPSATPEPQLGKKMPGPPEPKQPPGKPPLK